MCFEILELRWFTFLLTLGYSAAGMSLLVENLFLDFQLAFLAREAALGVDSVFVRRVVRVVREVFDVRVGGLALERELPSSWTGEAQGSDTVNIFVRIANFLRRL